MNTYSLSSGGIGKHRVKDEKMGVVSLVGVRDTYPNCHERLLLIQKLPQNRIPVANELCNLVL